ncbi:MliC family protein [Paraburkholderia pallida]|uniref:Transcriptional regulator n=1 Tax=Paraburkholderia pallida TaxID=2547399 RepID=A0A4P7CQF7_9BURK|nr:MliC family protein [Paraburkholderia pallida]QBQ98108.1 transcriptional regulator [Paraburkholderia pallida]
MTRRRSAARRFAIHFGAPGAARALPRRFAACALALAVFGAVAGVSLTVSPAQAASLDVREIQTQSRHTFRYTCAAGKTFKVTYINGTNGQSFALVPVEGRNLLFVGVIAASGVRYVADRYTWWTKGPGADLYDATNEDSPKPIVSGCATIMR